MTANKNIITSSFDRTVYPLDSLMHVRVRLQKLIKNENIILLTISDKNKKTILSETINISKTKNLDPKGHLYQICIKMSGNRWNVGQSYMLHVVYSNCTFTSAMCIAKHKPILETDKSMYIIGSDIIVTVIAPDLDKDSEKREYIGDKSDHSLTISSDLGTIKNYKLRETDKSTGIFQAIIGLLPPFTIKKGKRIRNKARGTGLEDGYLPVGIGKKITFEFHSKSGNAKLSVNTSNFGATVELDKKIYNPRDQVHLTILAPDFNYNFNAVDKIGNLSDCKITISTSKGILSGYQLHESGKDTGIFVGKLTLTGSKDIAPPNVKNTRWGITKGKGSTDGLISCADEDQLSVKFESANFSVVGRALIKYNVGKIYWDKYNYARFSDGKILVIDPDMSMRRHTQNKLKIRVWSESDLEGIHTDVIETNIAGNFEVTIKFTDTTSQRNQSLQVKKGDSIFAKYEDYTIPRQYKKTKPLDIISHAKIEDASSKTVKILRDSSAPHSGKYLEPEIITVEQGKKIVWENDDYALHNITSGTPKNGPDGMFASKLFHKPDFSFTFNEIGEYPYFCMIHPWKTGKIIVKKSND